MNNNGPVLVPPTPVSKRLLRKRIASAQRVEERAWADFRGAVAESYTYLAATRPDFASEVRDFADEITRLAQSRHVTFPVLVLALAEVGVHATRWAKEQAATLRAAVPKFDAGGPPDVSLEEVKDGEETQEGDCEAQEGTTKLP